MARRLLLVQYSSNLDGSAFSGLMLANGLREAGWDTHVTFAFEGPIIERYRADGHEVRVVPHKSWLRTRHHAYFVRNFLRERAAARRFDEVFAEVQPDLVYVNTCVSLAGVIAARRHRAPCLWHLRELFDDVGGEMRVPFGFKPFVRACIRTRATRLVVNSEAVARNMLGPSASPVDVVPNAVNASFFEHTGDQQTARRKLGLPEQGTLLGVPGTLRPMKGHPFFFNALRDLGDADLVVAVTGGGTSAYTQELKALTERLGVAAQVRFMGYVEDMRSFYRACDLVCIPSVAEPFGRTVIEAFAAGTPVVATAVGGIRETVVDGHTGMLVAYGDTKALANRLRQVVEDAALRETLRANALAKATEAYHESVYKARICRIAAETCSGAGNGAARPVAASNPVSDQVSA